MKKKVGVVLGLLIVVVGMFVVGRYDVLIGYVKSNIGTVSNDGSMIISDVVVSSANDKEEIKEVPEYAKAVEASYENGYCYQLLDREEQEIYVTIYTALKSMTQTIDIRTDDADKVVTAHQYVMLDNPELFWVKGYKMIPYEMADKIVKVEYSPIYTMTAGEKANYEIAIEQKVNNWLAQMAGCTDDYSKVKKAYDLIIQNTSYDAEAKESQNIVSVFVYGTSVCQGYAEAFQYLCKHAGIDNILVTGTAQSKESKQPHAWNLVKMDGNYYQFDITWGEPNYVIDDTRKNQVKWDVSYKYFGMTDKEMEENHTVDLDFELPRCTKYDDNYFIKEGNYYTTLDKTQLKMQFIEAAQKGECVIHLKCDNNLLYESFVDYLFTQENIFKILKDQTEIQYSQDEDLRCISIFWDDKS